MPFISRGLSAARLLSIFLSAEDQQVSNFAGSDTLRPCSFTHMVGDTPPRVSYTFNLCPLFNDVSLAQSLDVKSVDETPPTRTERLYQMALGGAGLKRDSTLPAELQCPDHTWICLTVMNTRPSHPSEPMRVLQVVPVAGNLGMDPKHSAVDPTSRLEAATSGFSDAKQEPALIINLHGGYYNGLRQKAQFKFICDSSAAPEATSPQLAWAFNGTHAFTWKTKYACPTVVPGRKEKTPPPDPDDDNDPPIDDEDKDDREPANTGYSSTYLIVLSLLFAWYLAIRRATAIYSGFLHFSHGISALRALCIRLFRRNTDYASLPSYEALDSELVMFEPTPRRQQRIPMIISPYRADVYPGSEKPVKSVVPHGGSEGRGNLEDPLSARSEAIPLKPSPHARSGVRTHSVSGYGTTSISSRNALQ